MKRTLMFKNTELLDFEVDTATGETHILDAPDADDALLSSLGLVGPEGYEIVPQIMLKRCLSYGREDIDQILEAFGARSCFELVLMGHGLSLVDKLWYRAPGSTERWEDVNFFDNDWDETFAEAILTHDYKKLASSSPDVPDVTTCGHLGKAWERSDGRIQLLKEPLFESGVDLKGVLLGAELCKLLYGQDAYQPISIVERFGRRLTASPLMVGRDEELVQSWRLFAMGGYDVKESMQLTGPATPQTYIDVISRAGAANVSARVAKIFAFKALSFLADMHSGNFGIIRNIETGACHATPPFDYDRAFGFPFEGFPFESVCNNPKVAVFMCACSFSDLDSSWDWSWYDPQALEGFEERIVEAYVDCIELPSNFGEVISGLFSMQRGYVNEVAGCLE